MESYKEYMADKTDHIGMALALIASLLYQMGERPFSPNGILSGRPTTGWPC